MDGPMGLRERKKQRTQQTISDTAISLFLRHGFDQVSVVDIAAEAEVSKPTLFKYFPTKEDLVVYRFADHQTMSSTVVRQRQPGTSVLDALHRHFLDGLAERDPITGLNDDPAVLAFQALVYSTPSVMARVGEYLTQAEEELARTLAEEVDGRAPLGTDSREVTAPLLAGQVIATQRILASANWRRIVGGRPADDLYPEAVTDADHAFALLSWGLVGHAQSHPG
jgi:AcrR family transcriptional regulator